MLTADPEPHTNTTKLLITYFLLEILFHKDVISGDLQHCSLSISKLVQGFD